MATSTETVAFIAAGGTAVGALVGSTVGGITDAVLDLVRERRRARVGARLVQVDLTMAASRLKAIMETGTWWIYQDLPMTTWDLYRDALTARLDADSLKAVTQAVVGLRVLSEGVQGRMSSAGADFANVGDSVQQIKQIRGQATAAYNALAKLAGEEPVTGLLHESP